MSALDHPPAGAMWEAPHPLEKVNAELRAELAAAREELASLRRDAERYRKLRDKATQQTGHDVYGDGGCWTIGIYSTDNRLTLDAAIDAAIQESRDHD